MSPTFRFQTILNLRKRAEDEQQMVLAYALQAAASVRAQRQRVQVERLRLSDTLKETLQGLLDPSQIEQRYRYLNSLDQRLLHLTDDLERAEQTVLEERVRLAETMKERKTIERLKEYDHQALVAAHQKKEQEETDDLNVARHSRSA